MVQMERMSNNWLEVCVSERGAELQSVRGRRTGWEYLWQGDDRYWERRSPLLFPTVGRLSGDTARVRGVTYGIPMHGLVMDAPFQLVAQGRGTLTYRLESTPAMHRMYPFPFELEVRYRLCANHIEVKWQVKNTGLEEMPFHIGGHPGINYPEFDSRAEVHAYVDFGRRGPLESCTVRRSNCLARRRYELPLGSDGLLPLTNGLFERNAVIIDREQAVRAVMLDVNKRPYVTVDFNAPVLLLWSPEGKNAPFVCVEPWYGLCDAEGYNGELCDRPYTNLLAPGHRTVMGYTLYMDAEATRRTPVRGLRKTFA
jgi:galactose mutarotase-like enzyme